MRPVIGITPDFGATSARPGRPSLPQYELKQAYADAVLAAGGLPVVLPYSDDEAAAEEAAAPCGALGGAGGGVGLPPGADRARAHRRPGPPQRGRAPFEERRVGGAPGARE